MIRRPPTGRTEAGAGPAHGFTLVELLVVISLLSVIAAVVALNLSNSDRKQLDVAAQAVAAAVRHARSEAVRSGQPHGILVSVEEQRLNVYRLNRSIKPAAFVYDVLDPLTRQPYEVALGAGASGVVFVSSKFKFRDDPAEKAHIGFAGSSGTPQVHGPEQVWLLEAGDIKLSFQDRLSVVRVDPETGRVTIK